MAGHEHQFPHLPRREFAAGKRAGVVGARFQQARQVGAEAHLHDGHGPVLLLGQYAAEQRHRLGQGGGVFHAARVERRSVRLFHRGDLPDEGAVLRRLAVANHADGDIGPSVESVEQRHELRGVAVVFADGDRQKMRFAPRFEGVQQGQANGIVHVVADVGVIDHANRAGRERRRSEHHAR